MVRANVTCALVGTVCWSRGAPDPLSARRFISRAAVVLPRANLHAREANRRAGRAVGREALVEQPTSPRGGASRSPIWRSTVRPPKSMEPIADTVRPSL